MNDGVAMQTGKSIIRMQARPKCQSGQFKNRKDNLETGRVSLKTNKAHSKAIKAKGHKPIGQEGDQIHKT